jgi:hypothetical protein
MKICLLVGYLAAFVICVHLEHGKFVLMSLFISEILTGFNFLPGMLASVDVYWRVFFSYVKYMKKRKKIMEFNITYQLSWTVYLYFMLIY